MAILMLPGCDRGAEVIGEPSPKSELLDRIEGTWKTSNVTWNSVIQQAYDEYTITFFGRDTDDDFIYFTSTGCPSDAEFPGSGKFRLGTNVETDWLIAPEDWQITYAATDKELEFTFASSRHVEQTGDIILPIIPSWVFRLKR